MAALTLISVLACILSVLFQLVASGSSGTTRPGRTLASLHGTRQLLASISAHVDELVASPCGYDASLERAAMERAVRHADALGLDAASVASLAILLTACTKQTSCREPSELGVTVLRSWRDAIDEWRQVDCKLAGSLAEEGVAEAFSGKGVCGEAPWPRMLTAALLSAAPCALPAVHAPHVGPFKVRGGGPV